MENSNSAVVELSQVTTSEGQFPVLSRFTLTAFQGQFIGLYGPTGCGKTTVLRVVCGITVPASGTVTVAGQDLAGLSEGARRRFRRQIGLFSRSVLPQRGVLIDAIATPAILSGHSLGEARSLAAEALSICGIEPLSDSRMRDLSEGEKQLACLAQSLVGKPFLILADEPTAYLDQERAETVLTILSEYARGGGTVLAVSHNSLPGSYATAIDMEKLHHV